MANQLEDSKISNIELAGFRFMLLAWLVSLGMAIFSCYAYYKHYAASVDTRMDYVEHENCKTSMRELTPECFKSDDWMKVLCNDAIRRNCPHPLGQPSHDWHVENSVLWEERSSSWFMSGLYLFILSTLMFYAIRWSLTGRIKPLWLFKK